MKTKTKKHIVRYRLKTFLKNWNPNDGCIDFFYDLDEDSTEDEVSDHIYKILKELFLQDFWDDHGEEIGEYDLWKNYINDYFVTNFEKDETSYSHRSDPSGNSIKDDVNFVFNSGDEVEVSCDNFEEGFRRKKKWSEGLNVVISSEEILNWF